MRGYRRTDRLAELIREEVADILIRGLVKDLDIGFVTITKVKVSADLSYADVYFSVYQGDWKETKRQLEEHRIRIQDIMGRDLRLKRLPRLRFFEDRNLEYVEKIERLLKEISGGGEDSQDP